uniref:Spaetzle domain-containing protein n=1 Tax=Timema genevievae TaxID=629358 RepID=A0A7R9K6F9_TIMGE|nr:unnamed protein product [Timema genevievae]
MCDIVTDTVDSALLSIGSGDKRRDHSGSSLHQEVSPTLLSYCRKQLSNVRRATLAAMSKILRGPPDLKMIHHAMRPHSSSYKGRGKTNFWNSRLLARDNRQNHVVTKTHTLSCTLKKTTWTTMTSAQIIICDVTRAELRREERIELFIDENKALMKRMYGEFQMSTEYGPPRESRRTNKREAPSLPGVPDLHGPPVVDPANDKQSGESYFSKLRQTRQSSSFRNNQSSESGRVDACESKVEIVTPYWASNSAGKIRAIVNTQHFEQAIHQEIPGEGNRIAGQTINKNIAQAISLPLPTDENAMTGATPVTASLVSRVAFCFELPQPGWFFGSVSVLSVFLTPRTNASKPSIHTSTHRSIMSLLGFMIVSKVQTKRCSGDCGCEQKYKWHRLLAYDPDNDCKGIFMDWFLFPSCCVCRCEPTFGN